MKKPNVYWASDYAGIDVPRVGKFYYGYEETIGSEDEEEWCFSARFGNQEVIIPFSKLEAEDQCNCQDCLLHGIAQLISSKRLVFQL